MAKVKILIRFIRSLKPFLTLILYIILSYIFQPHSMTESPPSFLSFVSFSFTLIYIIESLIFKYIIHNDTTFPNSGFTHIPHYFQPHTGITPLQKLLIQFTKSLLKIPSISIFYSFSVIQSLNPQTQQNFFFHPVFLSGTTLRHITTLLHTNNTVLGPRQKCILLYNLNIYSLCSLEFAISFQELKLQK